MLLVANREERQVLPGHVPARRPVEVPVLDAGTVVKGVPHARLADVVRSRAGLGSWRSSKSAYSCSVKCAPNGGAADRTSQ